MTILLSALLLGFMGSFHCVGMCGPIVLALPLQGNNIQQKIFGGLLYNTGRTITYAAMGAVFGLLGQGLRLVGFQQVVSVIMGTLMVVSVLFPALFRRKYDLQKSSFKLIGTLKKTLAQMFSVRSFQSLFFIGLLNGLLPCGLVYIAIAGAIATASVVTGIWYMVLFGLGTIPMLLALGVAGNLVSQRIRQRINRLIPIMVVIVGVFFILRGLNLNIKYLSPTKDRIEKRFEKSLEEKQLSLQETEKAAAFTPDGGITSCCEPKN
jgi:sulfite exporter TauE/SafE